MVRRMRRIARRLVLGCALLAVIAVTDAVVENVQQTITMSGRPEWQMRWVYVQQVLQLFHARRVDAVLNPFVTYTTGSCSMAAAAATCNATISAVTTANTVIVATPNNSSDAGVSIEDWFTTDELTSTTNVLCTRGASLSALTCQFIVWEFNSFYLASAVQRGTKSLAAGTASGTVAISAVTTAKANVIDCGVKHTGGNINGEASSAWWTFSSTTQLTYQKNTADGVVALIGCYQVLERR